MMRPSAFLLAAAASLTASLAATAPALADLSGRYEGTKDASGAVIELTEAGTGVTGVMTMDGVPDTAAIRAKLVGPDRAVGSIDVPDLGTPRIDFTLSPLGLVAVGYDEYGPEEALFLPVGAPGPLDQSDDRIETLRSVLLDLARDGEPDLTEAERVAMVGCMVDIFAATMTPEHIEMLLYGIQDESPELGDALLAAYPDMPERIAVCEVP